MKLFVYILIGFVPRVGGLAQCDEPLDRIVTICAGDGMIQIVDAKGRVERSFGGSVTRNAQGATAQAPNFRVAVGDVLEVGAPQILTAVADQLDPCRRLFDPHSGKAIDLSWSREGRYSLDVAASRSGALTVNEKRDADGRPVSSYWNCYNVGANERLFHTEFGVEVVAIDASEIDATVAGDEVAMSISQSPAFTI